MEEKSPILASWKAVCGGNLHLISPEDMECFDGMTYHEAVAVVQHNWDLGEAAHALSYNSEMVKFILRNVFLHRKS